MSQIPRYGGTWAKRRIPERGIVGPTKSLAVEYSLVFALTPSALILLGQWRKVARQPNPEDPESVLTEMAKAIPMRRLANPLEVGELAAFLASG